MSRRRRAAGVMAWLQSERTLSAADERTNLGATYWVDMIGRTPHAGPVLAQGALAPDDRIRNRRGWQPVQAGPSPGPLSFLQRPQASSRQMSVP